MREAQTRWCWSISIKSLDHPGRAGTGAATPPSGGDFFSSRSAMRSNRL